VLRSESWAADQKEERKRKRKEEEQGTRNKDPGSRIKIKD